LLRLGGHYAKLWRHQSGGFLPHDILGTETGADLPEDTPADEMHLQPVAEAGTDDAPVATRV
jgi:ATP-binding cassette subfamily B multidrug efflux pump